MPDPKTPPLHKRFPGHTVMRSVVWFPDKDDPKKTSYKLTIEGPLHEDLANLMVSLQSHQSGITVDMLNQLKAITDTLNKKKSKKTT